jgi:pyruvate/2-oxoglutarate dehydrogenase complex dihydrolipoamide acyltransferase (E2) component/uncharacterized OsmC-like protein
MPKIGQAMEEGVVVEWHCDDGAPINAGDLLATIETDKSTQELESQWTGILHIVVSTGEEVGVGTVIARILVGDSSAAPAVVRTGGSATGHRPLASPKARAAAAALGVDLHAVVASAPDGVISVADVQRGQTTRATPGPDEGSRRRFREQLLLTGVRKQSARRLTAAWKAPHIVQMVEIDATALLAARSGLAAPQSMNDLLLHAAAGALAATPELNASIEDDVLTLYDGVDVGLAVNTVRGLVVPVIRGADRMSVAELAVVRARLVDAAQAGTIGPDDMGDASVTVSNLGPVGVAFGTPVLNLGEPVLIVVGTIEDRPVAKDGQVVVQPTLTLSIAYDHRVIDGAAAAHHTTDLKRRLETVAAPEPTHHDRHADAVTAARGVPRHDPLVAAFSDGDGYAVTVQHGTHRWLIDEPVDVGGANGGPDPVSAFLGALASCMIISFKSTARRRNLAIHRITAAVSPPVGKLTAINLGLTVWSREPADVLDGLLDRAKRACIVSGALDPAIDITLSLEVRTP